MLQILTLIIIITIPTIALEPNFSLPDWQGVFQKFVSVRVAFTVFLLEAFFFFLICSGDIAIFLKITKHGFGSCQIFLLYFY